MQRQVQLIGAAWGLGGERLAAVELVEYCPRLDRDGRSAAVAAELAVAALCGAREEPQVLAHALDRR